MDKIQEEIIGEFSVFDDWLDKYDYLIGLSDSLPAIAAEHRTEQYLIDGCQSRLSANLSPTRSNGLLSMVKQMRLYALAFASKSEK